MAEAIDISNQFHITELDTARTDRLKATLIYLTKEYRESRSKIQSLSIEVKTIMDEIKNAQFKRKRLMNQNFSAADHLKKTHEKYWKEIQGKTRLYQVKRSQLQFYIDKVELLKTKIPEIRENIINIIH